MSPLLFSLFINPVVRLIMESGRGYKLRGRDVIPVLAFANDLTLLASTMSDMGVGYPYALLLCTWDACQRGQVGTHLQQTPGG